MIRGSNQGREPHQALLVVDVQRDFCPGGALVAPGGSRLVPVINRYIAEARDRGLPVYASRDWHPAVTTHFKAYGGQWPPHCVQGTPGAEFHPDLKLPADVLVISKGDHPEASGYSVVDGHTPTGKSFLDDLRDRGIDSLYVAGIATEYCVKSSVVDALRAGLDVTVLSDAVTGIDVNPGDADRALADMRHAGAHLAASFETTPQPNGAR